MRRIVVVGAPGSGKTTVSTQIAHALDLPRIELDALHWGPDWTEVGNDLFRARLQAAVAADEWVVDGNYFSMGSSDIVWPRADTIVFLDLRKRTVVRRVFNRTIRRSLLRTDLWSGNRESLRKGFAERDSIVRFVWTEYPKYPARYRALEHDPAWSHVAWIRLASPAEVRAWLASLT